MPRLRGRGFKSFMAGALAGVAIFAVALPSLAWDRGQLSDYHDRRARLVSETGDGVIVLFGYHEDDVAASVTTFHQNEEFYYLTGWNEPDAMMLLVPKVRKDEQQNQPAEIAKEILFIPPHDYREEKWTGPKLGPDDPDASAQTGFPTAEPLSRFHSELLEALKKFPKLYTELTPQPESGPPRPQ